MRRKLLAGAIALVAIVLAALGVALLVARLGQRDAQRVRSEP